MSADTDVAERDLAAVAAALLDQGRRVDSLSRAITVAALIGLLLAPTIPGWPPLLLAMLAPAAVLGLVEVYLAVRVGFDAALFHRLAAAPEMFDPGRLDRALSRLGLVPPDKIGRPMAGRIAGARRLLVWQGGLLGTQALLLMVGAGVALLRTRSGG